MPLKIALWELGGKDICFLGKKNREKNQVPFFSLSKGSHYLRPNAKNNSLYHWNNFCQKDSYLLLGHKVELRVYYHYSVPRHAPREEVRVIVGKTKTVFKGQGHQLASTGPFTPKEVVWCGQWWFWSKASEADPLGLERRQVLEASVPELSDWAVERRRTAGL